jgi:hypothetical protein
MAALDYIQLQHSEDDQHVIFRAGVTEWPPPETIWVVYPAMDEIGDGRTLICPTESLEEISDIYVAHGVEAVVTQFVQVRRSQISDDDIAEMTHVARGALYVVA